MRGPRVLAVASALHEWCKSDWDERFKNGAIALTMHDLDAHLYPEGRIESFIEAMADQGYVIELADINKRFYASDGRVVG